MLDDVAVAEVARTYLLEIAPVLALRIDGAARLVDANAQARRLLGNEAIGRPWSQRVLYCSGSLDLAAPVDAGGAIHRVTLSTVSGMPQTLYFRFFPLPDGTLALGSLNLHSQQNLSVELLALNGELNDLTRQLHQANAELREVHELKNRLAAEMEEHNRTLHQQTLASLNLMEDAVAAQKRAERTNQALQVSEAQFRALVEGAPDAIYVVTESSFVYLNLAACRLFGAESREHLVGQSVLDRCHPSILSSARSRLQKLFRERESVPTIEQTFVRLDGSLVSVDVTSVPITYEGKQRAVAFARDITERKKAQEAVSESEKRYRSTLESAPDPIVVVDRRARIILVNSESERVFGYQREELIGQSIDLILPSSFWACENIAEQDFRLAIRRAASATEGYATRKDGVEIPVEVRLSPDTGPDVIFSIRDLSELRRAEAKFQRLLEAAPDAIVVANEEGQVVLMNTQAEKMFGYSSAKLLAGHLHLSFPGDFQREKSGELFGFRADGSEFPIEVTLSPLQMNDGVFAVRSIRDVTERKETERRSRQLEILAAEAEAANKAKSMFLSTMSHEIRTPLNAILGYTQLMLRDPSLGGSAQANLKIVNRSGEHLLNIINDVLDMAKIEAGRMQLTLRAFNLSNLLLDMESMFRLRAEAKRIHFEVHLTGEPMEYIVADEGKIRQVLINLLGNAVKFTERGRINLNVSVRYTNDRLWLVAQVEDTGLGLTVQEQSRLFRPFVQAHAGEQAHNGGTGLGLAISQGIAKLMDGSIFVSSLPGNGSTFTLEIPIRSGDAPDLRKASLGRGRVLNIQTGQEIPRILIADDVMDNREWLSRLLTMIGFSVRLAENGEAAVRSWEEWNPHLILMDVHMPTMNGLEATRLIRSLPGGKETVIIALTADALEDHRKVVLQDEMTDFLSKPCLESELLEKIRAHLGVVYVYEDQTITNPPESGAGREPVALTPEDLSGLPVDLMRRMRDATFNGDRALLKRLILLVEEREGGQPARSLLELANAYQYTTLIESLDKACER
jgi:PAS domain S-box-containing protein